MSEEPGQLEEASPDAADGSDLLDQVVELIDRIDARVPEAYRVEAFRLLSPALVDGAAAAGRTRRHGGEPRDAPAAEWGGVNLSAFEPALAQAGQLLLKSLIALEVVSAQLSIEWMTPAEIERFLVERARARHVYRTNVSNVLRRARGLVDRRRRGRAYEYRITDSGRARVARELAIVGRRSE